MSAKEPSGKGPFGPLRTRCPLPKGCAKKNGVKAGVKRPGFKGHPWGFCEKSSAAHVLCERILLWLTDLDMIRHVNQSYSTSRTVWNVKKKHADMDTIRKFYRKLDFQTPTTHVGGFPGGYLEQCNDLCLVFWLFLGAF